mmetsp:Transcript_6276/g.14287  ORF Transcript_6276/g.14287 Transcript_6276/m.14287 type:complete len:245 (-) Transcript_6276:76-810(-)
MVRMKLLAVLLDGEDDVAARIERRLHVNRRAVRAWPTLLVFIAPWQLLLRTGKAHEPPPRTRLGDASLLEHLAKRHARPVRVAHGARSPIEPDALLDLVLLLAPVARASHEAWEGDGAHARELVHGDCDDLVDIALDGDGVLAPLQHRDSPVIAHEMEVHGRDPTVVNELRQLRLDVEWVFSRETHQIRVTLDPRVWRLGVAFVHNRERRGEVFVFAQVEFLLVLLVRVVVLDHDVVVAPSSFS